MRKSKRNDPTVGEHVVDQNGVERIVTDIRKGNLILRPLRGRYQEFPAAPSEVIPLAPRPD